VGQTLLDPTLSTQNYVFGHLPMSFDRVCTLVSHSYLQEARRETSIFCSEIQSMSELSLCEKSDKSTPFAHLSYVKPSDGNELSLRRRLWLWAREGQGAP